MKHGYGAVQIGEGQVLIDGYDRTTSPVEVDAAGSLPALGTANDSGGSYSSYGFLSSGTNWTQKLWADGEKLNVEPYPDGIEDSDANGSDLGLRLTIPYRMFEKHVTVLVRCRADYEVLTDSDPLQGVGDHGGPNLTLGFVDHDSGEWGSATSLDWGRHNMGDFEDTQGAFGTNGTLFLDDGHMNWHSEASPYKTGWDSTPRIWFPNFPYYGWIYPDGWAVGGLSPGVWYLWETELQLPSAYHMDTPDGFMRSRVWAEGDARPDWQCRLTLPPQLDDWYWWDESWYVTAYTDLMLELVLREGVHDMLIDYIAMGGENPVVVSGVGVRH